MDRTNMSRTKTDPPSSPEEAFGTQLRRSREAKGLSQKGLGRLIQFSGTYVSYIETARRPPTLPFAQAADRALGTGGTLELLYWNTKHRALLEGFSEYAALEAKATAVRLFELAVIPGLLQCNEYATAWEAGNVRRGTATKREADERVAFLLTRQGCLARTPPPAVHAVVDEYCLRRPIGGRTVMAAQMHHLEALAEHPNVVIQIAPTELGEDRPFSHPVTLLTLPDRGVVGYGETEQRGYLDRQTDSVASLVSGYDRLKAEALSRSASLRMIRDLRKGLEQ
ncbi:transcriptional regulator with XRE-family HTH domain [Kitasatospora sp. MAP12-15]|uniref:helix-turn-helix domain-containing protein n=1 Tax=unclassified Kitasatospora TaxID=2633591 RepID=UPI002473995E|nr:helix-turn-helix transcriptional regulator [Kitasatospora sp. MAP12-44]MDH6109368.1 transcriptional regulator with XRE-family HTH domain [Kitasatospora sp. MAP12-44]